MEANKVAIKPHAIMIAIPLQGHINPFVHLAIKLASKGFAITFVHTEHTHHQITKSLQKSCPRNTVVEFDIFSEARNSGLDIRYMTISDGLSLEYDRNSNVLEYWEYMLKEFPSLVDEFVGHLIEESSLSDPTLVPVMVADTLASWPVPISKKYNMVNVSFWTEPALVFALDYHMGLLTENGHFPCLPGNRDRLIDYVPGVEPIHVKDLTSHLQDSDTTTIIHEILFKGFEEVKKADFVLHNTVQELESHRLSALNQLNPTYAIGPVNFSFDYTSKINVSKSMLSEMDCTEWLNSKPRGSVLYISFGSLVQTNKQIMQEIAQGLHLSKVNFLWTIRPQMVADETNVLPVGFEDDVKDKGLIVPWCNQNAVLSHPAVGGFLTHCGWNSIVESIWFGIPMICYPMLYDQPTNRKLVVDDWKVGINLCDGAEVDKEGVATKIKTLMSEETSDHVRNEMKKLEKMMRNAVAADGSSERNFDRFVHDLKDKMHSQANYRPSINGI